MLTIPTNIQPGAVVYLDPGVYSASRWTIPNVTIKSKTKWGAHISGAPAHGFEVRANNVTLEGLRISGCGGQGIKTYGNQTVVRDCWIERNYSSGILGSTFGTIIERCLIERNGRHPRWDHGVYVGGHRLVISNCVVRYNASCGVHLYPDSSGAIVRDCEITDHPLYGILVSSNPIVDTSVDAGATIQGNRIAGSPVAIMFFHKPTEPEHLVQNNTIDPDCHSVVSTAYGKATFTEVSTIRSPVDRSGVAAYSGGPQPDLWPVS